jgi:DNA-binding LytR/AlgR family response regulator
MKDSSLFTALIVDDEENGREQVAYHLNRHKDARIVGSVDSVDAALKILDSEIPDIIFLDIEMPKKNGFELVEEIAGLKPMPRIVFVTAYDQYAIQAIKHSAFDYILKPIAKGEFDEVLEKFRQRAPETDLQKEISGLLSKFRKPGKLRFNQKGQIIFIDPAEIVYCKADGNYTEIYTGENQFELVSQHLKDVMEQLNEDFQRLGRSLIINRTYLSRIDRIHQLVEFSKHEMTFTLPVSARVMHNI